MNQRYESDSAGDMIKSIYIKTKSEIYGYYFSKLNSIAKYV